jgi:hypothetical protein
MARLQILKLIGIEEPIFHVEQLLWSFNLGMMQNKLSFIWMEDKLMEILSKWTLWWLVEKKVPREVAVSEEDHLHEEDHFVVAEVLFVLLLEVQGEIFEEDLLLLNDDLLLDVPCPDLVLPEEATHLPEVHEENDLTVPIAPEASLDLLLVVLPLKRSNVPLHLSFLLQTKGF